MKISVIITTYNQPLWLELTLRGFATQNIFDFDVVLADDGSGPATGERIESLRSELPFELTRVWHEDRGFRKTEILNRAIMASRHEYLVFTDGDCIPRRDFLSTHQRLAEPGRFLSGGYIKLPRQVSEEITAADVAAGRATDMRWLRARGAPVTRWHYRLGIGKPFGALLDRITPTRPSFNGHNASVWRNDLLAVNGFEERMGYGGLDRELGERLENAGIRGKQIRHRAVVVHLDHPRGYVDPAVLAANRRVRDEVAASRRTRAVVGLDRHLPPG
jgi:glycosyltransferase involved in cell wall biosynthesis